MNDLAVRTEHELPASFGDLSKFVLVGREKLVAVRAEIRAIDKDTSYLNATEEEQEKMFLSQNIDFDDQK